MKSTDDLISEISKSHVKVSRDLSPVLRTFLSLYVTSAFVITSLYLVKPFTFELRNIAHAAEILSMLLLTNALTYLGFKSFVPGEAKIDATKFVAISFVFLLISFVTRVFVPQSYSIVRPNCEFEAMAISLLTTLIGYVVIRKNEFAMRAMTSKVIFLSLPMIATVFLEGACSLQWTHVLTCHVIAPLMIPLLFLLVLNIKKA